MILLGVFVIDNPQCGNRRYTHPQLAFAYLEKGRYEQALVEAQRALRQHGDDPALYLIAALAQLGQDQIEAAVLTLEQGLQIDPDDERIHPTLRRICQDAERFDLARDVLERLLEQHPNSVRTRGSLGWVYAQLGEDEQAVELLNEALASEPDDDQLLLAMGDCQLRQGQPEAAARSFAQALAKSKLPVATAVAIARHYYEQGMRRQTIEYYERAMEHEAEDPLILNNLAWTYAEEGIRLDRALELATRAVKLEADNVVYLDTYAEVFFQKGQHARAIAVMRRALELEPEDGEQYEYLQEQLEKFRRAYARAASTSGHL